MKEQKPVQRINVKLYLGKDNTPVEFRDVTFFQFHYADGYFCINDRNGEYKYTISDLHRMEIL